MLQSWAVPRLLRKDTEAMRAGMPVVRTSFLLVAFARKMRHWFQILEPGYSTTRN